MTRDSSLISTTAPRNESQVMLCQRFGCHAHDFVSMSQGFWKARALHAHEDVSMAPGMDPTRGGVRRGVSIFLLLLCASRLPTRHRRLRPVDHFNPPPAEVRHTSALTHDFISPLMTLIHKIEFSSGNQGPVAFDQARE